MSSIKTSQVGGMDITEQLKQLLQFSNVRVATQAKETICKISKDGTLNDITFETFVLPE